MSYVFLKREVDVMIFTAKEEKHLDFPCTLHSSKDE